MVDVGGGCEHRASETVMGQRTHEQDSNRETLTKRQDLGRTGTAFLSDLSRGRAGHARKRASEPWLDTRTEGSVRRRMDQARNRCVVASLSDDSARAARIRVRGRSRLDRSSVERDLHRLQRLVDRTIVRLRNSIDTGKRGRTLDELRHFELIDLVQKLLDSALRGRQAAVLESEIHSLLVERHTNLVGLDVGIVCKIEEPRAQCVYGLLEVGCVTTGMDGQAKEDPRMTEKHILQQHGSACQCRVRLGGDTLTLYAPRIS